MLKQQMAELTKEERLTDAQVEEIRSRRPAIRATLACEGLYLTKEEEALLDQMEDERLTHQESEKLALDFIRTRSHSIKNGS